MFARNKRSGLPRKFVNCRQKSFIILAQGESKCRDRNAKGGSITVPLTSCLTGLKLVVWQLTIFIFICKTDLSKPVEQEVNDTVILPPLVFPVRKDLLEHPSLGCPAKLAPPRWSSACSRPPSSGIKGFRVFWSRNFWLTDNWSTIASK